MPRTGVLDATEGMTAEQKLMLTHVGPNRVHNQKPVYGDGAIRATCARHGLRVYVRPGVFARHADATPCGGT